MPRGKIPFAKLKPDGIKDATWRGLIEAWGNGLSDREASFRVSKDPDSDDITVTDIAKWCMDNPEIGELRAALQNDLLTTAKLVIADNLRDKNSKEQIKTARWYAERKGANEFSTKQAVAFEGAVIELSLEDKEKKLKEMVEKFDHGE